MNITAAEWSAGKLTLTTSDPEALRFAVGFEAGDYSLAKAKKKRSLDANAYAWALIDKIAAVMRLSKLDRHEIFHADMKGKQRAKSKAWGLWVMLCHESCHEYGKWAVHRNKDVDRMLKQEAQQRAQDYYGITTDEFIEEFGRSYL